jgi:tRNA threonylcarbamoyladenosine biosynthesis protein TsaE
MGEKELHSPEEMQQFGFGFASKLNGGDIVLLHGDLGAGKTTLTKGIAQYFGIDEVVSPTFTLMQEYKIEDFQPKAGPPLAERLKIKRLLHVDTYRLDSEDQLIDIGIEDYLGEKNTICIIEWPEKMEKLLENKKVVNVVIEHLQNGRLVKVD